MAKNLKAQGVATIEAINADPLVTEKLAVQTAAGNEFIVTPQGTTPQGQMVLDAYFPSLYRMVVSQEVNNQLRGVNLLIPMEEREAWVNGLKQFFTQGISEIKDWTKPVTINDWNPYESTKYSQVATIDKREYASVKLPAINDMIAAFTNPSSLASFTNQIIDNVTKTFMVKYQNQQAVLMTASTGAIVPISPDLIIDTHGASNEELLQAINILGEDFKVASASNIRAGEFDSTLLYSGNNENFKLVWNTKKKAAIDKDVNAKLYHAQVLDPKYTSTKVYSFDKSAGVDILPDAMLYDKSAVLWGTEINDFTWAYNAPKGQRIIEVHNWYGYYRNWAFPLIVFRDLTTYPITTKDNYVKPDGTSVTPTTKTVAQVIA